MKLGIKQHLIIFVLLTLVPLLSYVVFGLVGFFGGLKPGNAILIITALSSLSIYGFLIFEKTKKKDMPEALISILYYLNFLIYMIAVLISFNLIVIAGFLYTDQVPMGLTIDPSKATLTLILGIYILLISAIGMHFLSSSRKKLLTS